MTSTAEQARSIIAGTPSDSTTSWQADVEAATTAAAEAFASYRATSPVQRAEFLERVAAEIEADKVAIIEAAVAESNLGRIRLASGDCDGAATAFEAAVGLLEGADEDEDDVRDVADHVGHQVEGRPVFRPAGEQEFPGRDALVTPAGKREQAGVDDQRRVHPGQGQGGRLVAVHGGARQLRKA